MLVGTDGYTRGYRSQLTKEQRQEFQMRFCEKSLTKGIAFTAAHLMGLFAFIYVAFWSATNFDAMLQMVPAFILCMVGATRQMRALENIVHFGSHHNFTRNKRLNDWLTNILAAWPMLHEVVPYREFHLSHHADYGSDEDPCRNRLKQIGVTVSEIDNKANLFAIIIRWYPLYVWEYYREISSNKEQLVRFILWHLVATIIAAIVFSPTFAIYQLIFFITCMGLTLPCLRSVAELSEHDYERGDNVKDTTFNNLGWLDHILIHPAGDAWHALHHLFPSVSWWNQARAHRFLIKSDKAYNSVHSRSLFFKSETTDF